MHFENIHFSADVRTIYWPSSLKNLFRTATATPTVI